MIRIVQGQFDWKGGRAGIKIDSQAPHEWPINWPAGTVATCVCRRCNSGWMSDIEQAAKPALTNMIQGNTVELDPETQEAVGTWMCLKAILSAYVKLLAPMPQEWLTNFNSHHCPPADNWAVYTTRYTGAPALAADGSRIGPRSGMAAPIATSAEQGVFASFIIGHLAIQGYGMPSPVILHERVDIHRIWPASPLTLLWPPIIEIDDTNLTEFRSMGLSTREKPYELTN